jgi:hypothetical protein
MGSCRAALLKGTVGAGAHDTMFPVAASAPP